MADEKKTDAEEAAKAAQAKEEQVKTAPQSGRGATPSPAAIAKAIDGLQFRTNKELPVLDDNGKPVKENGRAKVRYVPDLRPMTARDVLSAAYDGDGQLVIVAKDGSKYRINKG